MRAPLLAGPLLVGVLLGCGSPPIIDARPAPAKAVEPVPAPTPARPLGQRRVRALHERHRADERVVDRTQAQCALRAPPEKKPQRAEMLALVYLTKACRGRLREELWSAYCRLSRLIGLPRLASPHRV